MVQQARTVIVTGANRGIGLALVRAYLDGGDAVFALCRDPVAAEHLKALRTSAKLTVLPVDVGRDDSVGAVRSTIGDRPVDLLINNAGTLHMEKQPADIDFDAWRLSFEVMTLGPIRMALAFLPNLEQARGRIVNVTSQVGASDWSTGGFYSYGAAKAALNRAMKSLALDLRGRGVSVALVHPGLVRTALGGPDAPLEPSESATGIKAVADRLDLATSGCFVNWDGTPHAW